MNTTWETKEKFLQKTFEFKNFQEALDFVNKVGKIAEELQHHPDISIKNYKQVFISTTTHSAENTITEKDHSLTQAIDALI